MATQPVSSIFRRLMSIRTTWLLVLLATVAASLWQCGGEQPTSIVVPEKPIEFIDSVFPADGAIDVPLGSCVEITFLRQMDTATMTPNKFHFDIDNIYSLSIDTLKADMCAARGLDRATEYHVVIDSGIADTAGNVMTTPYAFSFRTESGDAFISSVSPTNGQVDVPLDADIKVTFNQGMNNATLVPSNIVVSNGVTGTLAYADRRLVFTPNDSLEPYHEYTVTLKAAIADSAGATLGQDYSWTFTTIKVGNGYIQSVFPVDGAIEVPVDANPHIQFSVAIDPTSLTPEDFTISGGVTGTVSVIGTYKSSVSFNPTGDLQYGTSYTAAFHGNLTSTTGQAIHIDHTWSFTTADTMPPQVVSVSPVAGAIGVPINPTFSITFNKTLAPASFTYEEFRVKERYSEWDRITVFGNTVTLDPNYELQHSQQYTAAFDGDISDQNGHSGHINYTWTFTTCAVFNLSSYYPAANEGCTPLDASIHMEFSHVLDSTTVTPANIVIEEYNGPRLPGVFSCHDSIVEFQPDAPLSPLKTYKVTLLTGIKETYGEPLPYTRSWLFSAKGENLLPLAIGNKWIYQTGAGVDSVVLVGDTLIMGKLYYLDQHKLIYRCESDTLEFSKYGFPIFGNPHIFVNSDCVNRSGTVTTENGTFLCQRFQQQFVSGPQVTQQFDFAPGVGLVRFFEDYWSGGSGDPHHVSTWVLVSYQLQ